MSDSPRENRPAADMAARHVCVCIASYRRPVGLERLLRGLDRLEFRGPGTPGVEILVVDNDPSGSAAELCAELRPQLRRLLHYAHEPRRGISHARNRAVQYAIESGADFAAFIDDDEIPEPQWLNELLRVQEEHDADVVWGPVLRSFEAEVPAWIHKGRFFEDPRYATGAPLKYAATNNALVRTSVFAVIAPAFDERYGLTGGEDTHFFLRVARAGFKLVWADDAVVQESIPESRARTRWIMQRAYRVANTWSRCEREFQPSARSVGIRVAKGLMRVVIGVSLLPLSLALGRHVFVRGLWYLSHGVGNMSGVLGLSYQEYRTTHGK